MSEMSQPLVPRGNDTEAVKWRVNTSVEKWFNTADYEAGRPPDEVVEDKGNILTTAGINRILSLMIGAGGQAFTENFTRLGVGNGTTPPAVGDTDLVGPSKLYHGLDVGYPAQTGTTITFRATYGEAEANWRWTEWGIDLGGAGSKVTNANVVAPLLNRRVPPTNLGEKTGGTWTLTTQITLQ